MVDTKGWTARKKLKHSLLRRAFDEGRGPEVILLIQWRTAYTKHKASPDAEAVQAIVNEEKQNKENPIPRALRALNMLESKEGRNVSYTQQAADTSETNTTKGLFKMLAEMPVEQRILYRDPLEEIIAKTPAMYPDHYDPMEGLKIVSAYDMACLDEAAAYQRPLQKAQPAPALIQ